MASTSSTGVAPSAVVHGDVQQSKVSSPSNNYSPGDTTPALINPLLLLSACFGSSEALDFLFRREDRHEAPMTLPTQEFLDKLVGWTEGSTTKRRLTVPQASDDVEHGVHQPSFPVISSHHEVEDVADQHDLPARASNSHSLEDGVDQSDLPAAASHEIEDVVGQAAFRSAASHDVEDGVDQPALAAAASRDMEDAVDQPPDLPVTGSQEPEDGVDQPASQDIEDGINLPSSPTSAPHEVEVAVEQHALSLASNLLKGVTAEGNTALHVVASHGDNPDCLMCATIIDTRNKDLLFAINKKGDTPLHCAVRAGKSQIVSRLIELARSRNRMHALLRKENVLKETALHDAVRIGNKHIVETLLKADTKLANYPKEGTSPLYLAISLENNDIARTLHDKSNGNLSYSGPHGQNALHAATFRGTGITEYVLKWNSSLTTHGDMDGSTPLHFASSFGQYSLGFRQLFEANPAPVYQADNKGFFPIHVAASIGTQDIISIILEMCPSTAGLCTSQGRTFLHVAVENRRLNVVSFVCKTPSLNWILNMQDRDGNTALHLAVQDGKFRIFCSLYGNKEVHLSLENNSKQTPLDLARSMLPRGLHYYSNTESWIYNALAYVGAKYSCRRVDKTERVTTNILELKLEDATKEAELVKDASQILGIGSVLIATVAFGATFALPGGYVADDHANGGTPTRVGRYTFDAFMMAITLAFVCSSIATIGLMFSGTSMVNLKSRQINLNLSVFFLSSSLTSLAAAFALGVYIVLAPVAHGTAIVVCVLSPLVVLYKLFEVLMKWCILARPLYLRMGIILATKGLAKLIVQIMFIELWPFILIFGWAAIARSHRNHL